MKKTVILTLALFTLPFLALSQFIFEEYDWSETGEYLPTPEAYAENDEFMVKKRVLVELKNEIIDGKEVLRHYEIVHTIIQVNTDEAIEDNNRIYVRYLNEDELIQKARVILPSGKVIDLKEEDILTSEDEDQKGTKYFALEGLEIGAQIEHFYQREAEPNITGVMVYAQGQKPILDYSYKLYHPSYLRFAHRAYNIDWEPISTEPSEERSALEWKVKDIPGVADQAMSYFDAGMRRFSYKLDKNVFTGASNIINYKRLNENIYQQFMSFTEKDELKALKKMAKEIKLDDDLDTETKVRTIENYIKNNYNVFLINLSFFGVSSNLNDIMNSKLASKDGYVRLHLGLFEHFGIKNELVFTTSRSDYNFEKDFENYMYLDKYLIYFPELDQYIAPNVPNSRLGIVPSSWTDNYGFFVKPVSLAGVRSGISEIKYIKAAKMEENFDEMIIEVDLDFDEAKAEVNYHKTLSGVYAQNYQPEFADLNDDKKEELEELMAKFVSEDVEIVSSTLSNIEENDFGAKPLIHDFTISSDAFLSVAGDKVLFSIGELIGPQQELYLEEGEERILPVDVGYNHGYYRTIAFDVPEGYEVKNLDDLNMDITYERDGEQILAFVSRYEVDGKRVKVIIDEVYRDHHFPVEEFENFRAVINGAADFNKLVLVFGEN